LSTPFQNRLVGTIIVAAVVIIFLPDVLDGEKVSHQTDFESIPKAEVFSGKLTNKPFPEEKIIHKKDETVFNEPALDDIALLKSTSPTGQVTDQVKVSNTTTSKVVTQTKPKPAVKVATKTSKQLPEKAVAKEAWVIHLGSFKDKDNVALLLKKLKSQGYVAFTKPIKTKQGTLTKVIIGPELIKSSMVKKLPALKTLTKIQGKVAHFEPID